MNETLLFFRFYNSKHNFYPHIHQCKCVYFLCSKKMNQRWLIVDHMLVATFPLSSVFFLNYNFPVLFWFILKQIIFCMKAKTWRRCELKPTYYLCMTPSTIFKILFIKENNNVMKSAFNFCKHSANIKSQINKEIFIMHYTLMYYICLWKPFFNF